jgi:hypothetical protein
MMIKGYGIGRIKRRIYAETALGFIKSQNRVTLSI